jgi:hypothetical protein
MDNVLIVIKIFLIGFQNTHSIGRHPLLQNSKEKIE